MVTAQERWLPVAGYEGSYEVSDLGRVRSIPRCCMHYLGGTSKLSMRMLKPVGGWGKVGGYMVFLSCGGSKKWHKIKDLIAAAFPIPGAPEAS